METFEFVMGLAIVVALFIFFFIAIGHISELGNAICKERGKGVFVVYSGGIVKCRPLSGLEQYGDLLIIQLQLDVVCYFHPYLFIKNCLS